MSLDNTKLAVWKAVRIYKGLPTAERPNWDTFDPANPPVGLTEFAHTSKDSAVKPTAEGGELTNLDSAAASGVYPLKAPVVRGLEFESLEIKEDVADAAWNGYITEDGWYAIPAQSDPEECSILVYMVSTKGKTFTRFGVGTITSGAESETSFEKLNSVPLKVTFKEDADGNTVYVGGSLMGIPVPVVI